MNTKTPKKSRRLVDDFHEAIMKRSKALKYRGELTVDYDSGCDDCRLELLFAPLDSPYIEMNVDSSNRINLYIRSHRRKTNGKILFCIEDMRVVGNAEKMLDAFERTIGDLHYVETETPMALDSSILEIIERRWRAMQIG